LAEADETNSIMYVVLDLVVREREVGGPVTFAHGELVPKDVQLAVLGGRFRAQLGWQGPRERGFVNIPRCFPSNTERIWKV